jgi:single-stranded DNA-binding protein
MNGIEAAAAGRLIADAERKYLPNGTPVLNFAIAIADSRSEADAELMTCSIYANHRAGFDVDALEPRLRRGQEVHVVGKLKLSRWSSEDGRDHARLQLAVAELSFLGLARPAPARGRSHQFSLDA